MDNSEDRLSRDDQPLPTDLEMAFARQAARDRKLLEDALRAQPRLADSAEAIVEHLKRERAQSARPGTSSSEPNIISLEPNIMTLLSRILKKRTSV
jgi:hypothetical protein